MDVNTTRKSHYSRTFCLFKELFDTYTGGDCELNFKYQKMKVQDDQQAMVQLIKGKQRAWSLCFYPKKPLSPCGNEQNPFQPHQKRLCCLSSWVALPRHPHTVKGVSGSRAGYDTESWMNSFSLDGQDLGWSQSLRLAADPLMARRNLPLVTQSWKKWDLLSTSWKSKIKQDVVLGQEASSCIGSPWNMLLFL